jgi:hypothetical protein
MQTRLNELLKNEGGSYILPFFWQHGEDEKTLREYMRAIRGANIREVCVESRPHPNYCGPKWWEDVDIILDEARQMEMRVWILDDSHFPSGYGNGVYDDCPAALCKQYLKFATAEVLGPTQGVRFDIFAEMAEAAKPIKPHVFPGADIPDEMKRGQPPIRVFADDNLLGVYAYRYDARGKLTDGRDVAAFVKNGILEWDVPEGRWRLFAAFATRKGGGVTSYMNVLDYDSVNLIVQNIYEPHYGRYRRDFGKTFAGFFSDEPLFGNFPWNYTPTAIGSSEMALPWSKDVPAMLEKRLGPDWLGLTPLLWAESADDSLTRAVRVQYMDALTELVKVNYSMQLGAWCDAHNVQYIGHIVEDMGSSGGLGASLGHFFRAMAGMHMGGVDVIGGQYVTGGAYRQETDRADFYHFTLGKLGTSYAHLDPRKGGRSMIELFGAYGWEFGVRDMKMLADHFLVSGVNRFVPHAFSPKAFPDRDCPPHFYAHGENPQYRHFGALMAYMQRVSHLIDGGTHIVPVAVLHADEAVWAGGFPEARKVDRAARVLLENQIDFDFVPADLISDPSAYALGKKLTVNGESFDALVVPQAGYAAEHLKAFLDEAAARGFPVLFSETDAALEKLPEDLDALGARHVRLDKSFPDLRYYRYARDGEVYIFVNESTGTAFSGHVTVPCAGPACVYDAWENCLRPVEAKAANGGTELNLTVRPYEPVIVAFGEVDGVRIPEAEIRGEKASLGAWTVSVCEAKEYPDFRLLAEGAALPNVGKMLPDFSGFIRYETHFATHAGEAVLEIGDAYEGVEVWLNDIPVGNKVAPRFAFDLSLALKPGENRLRIEVATNLARKTDKMLGKTFALYKKSPAVMPIGIVGSADVYLK